MSVLHFGKFKQSAESGLPTSDYAFQISLAAPKVMRVIHSRRFFQNFHRSTKNLWASCRGRREEIAHVSENLSHA